MSNIEKYYIDLENVGAKGIEGFDNLGEQGCLELIHSANFTKLPIKVVEEMVQADCQIAFHFVKMKGSNALDFYLTAMVISDIERLGDGCYYVVSKDSDFRHLEAYVNERYNSNNIKVIRCESIKDIIVQNLNKYQRSVTDDEYIFLAK